MWWYSTADIDSLCPTPRFPLTPPRAGNYIFAMSEAQKNNLDLEFKRLERQVDELVGMIQQLKEENRALRARQDSLATERATLLQKNEQVRTRVEAMIGRLKTLEHGT